MIYRVLADSVLWFHVVWGWSLAAGIFVMLKYPRYRPFQLASVGATCASKIVFWGGCPLTVLENALRAHYSPGATYQGSFTCHYAMAEFGLRLPPVCLFLALAAVTVASIFVCIRQNGRRTA